MRPPSLYFIRNKVAFHTSFGPIFMIVPSVLFLFCLFYLYIFFKILVCFFYSFWITFFFLLYIIRELGSAYFIAFSVISSFLFLFLSLGELLHNLTLINSQEGSWIYMHSCWIVESIVVYGLFFILFILWGIFDWFGRPQNIKKHLS